MRIENLYEEVNQMLDDEGIDDEEIRIRAIELVERMIELKRLYENETKH